MQCDVLVLSIRCTFAQHQCSLASGVVLHDACRNPGIPHIGYHAVRCTLQVASPRELELIAEDELQQHIEVCGLHGYRSNIAACLNTAADDEVERIDFWLFFIW